MWWSALYIPLYDQLIQNRTLLATKETLTKTYSLLQETKEKEQRLITEYEALIAQQKDSPALLIHQILQYAQQAALELSYYESPHSGFE